MRRILTSATRGALDWCRAVVSNWNGFWFTPVDPTPLAMTRILVGLMLVYTHAVWGLDLQAFFGAEGWLGADAVCALQADQYAYSYWWYIPTEWMWPAHLAALAVLVMFTVGFATRITSVLAFIITVSYANRVPSALFGLDQINAFLTLYCTIGLSGQALSVDRLLARRRRARQQAAGDESPVIDELVPSTAANLGLRLIQFHMCVIYLFAGLAKLQGTAWWTGEAMWLAFANLEYQSNDMTWLCHHPWIVNVMTHVTIAWEISFFALVWRPLFRPLMLFTGVMMHIGIGLFMGMWTFGLIMIVAYVAFLPASTVNAFLGMLAAIWARVQSLVSKRSPGVQHTTSESFRDMETGSSGPA